MALWHEIWDIHKCVEYASQDTFWDILHNIEIWAIPVYPYLAEFLKNKEMILGCITKNFLHSSVFCYEVAVLKLADVHSCNDRKRVACEAVVLPGVLSVFIGADQRARGFHMPARKRN